MSLVYQKTAELNNTHPWVLEKAQAHLKKINQTVLEIHGKLDKEIKKERNQNIEFYVHLTRLRIIK